MQIFSCEICKTLRTCILKNIRERLLLNDCFCFLKHLSVTVFHNSVCKELNLSIKSEMPEAAVPRCSVEKVFLEISQNSQESSCARVFFNRVTGLACNFITKETLAQVFSCKFCETSKNTVLYNRTPTVASSENMIRYHFESM